MRIVQIIDSLEVGGAEKMAVNYANALSERIEFSGLVTTRNEGDLKVQISAKVNYLFLEKQKTIDFSAALRLKKYCKTNRVDLIHSHSSSYFIALLVKLLYPKIKIIWHDHNGMSEYISTKETYALKLASFFFEGIIVVNHKLKHWAEKRLNCRKVIYFPNFTSYGATIAPNTVLEGTPGKRILCLANLRDQKNHFFLLKIAEKLKESNPDWTFHLIGKDFKDKYSKEVKKKIKEKQLDTNVYVYGSRNDVFHIINQSDIAILTSKSEGLPVALIEYGLSKVPVVSTKVGEIPLIISNGINGFITDIDDVAVFLESLQKLIADENVRRKFGNALYDTIMENHSEAGVIEKYLNWIKSLAKL
ncbi:glycosyltransferase [Flavobacterium sp.]|uniref:glycosyltransferase n=1 Tax=Flavobacterium sp. TaxID=239 RepID=UPI002FD95EE8